MTEVERIKFINSIALFAHICNFVDGSVSLHLFEMFPYLTEGNPVMGSMLNVSSGIFIGAKILLGNGGIWLLSNIAKRQRKSIALYALIAAAATLCSVSLLNVVSLAFMEPLEIVQ